MNLDYKTKLLLLPGLQDIFTLRKNNTETPVKILILKQIYTETSEPSLEALLAMCKYSQQRLSTHRGRSLGHSEHVSPDV